MFNLHSLMPKTATRWVSLALWPAAVLLATPAHALFSDDEARRAILDLRNRVETNRQAAEASDRKLSEELKDLSEGGVAATRRSMLDLVNQIEALRRELAEVRGQNEKLVKVTLEGQEFTARPEEKAAFDAAMTSLRATDFAAAARQYGQLLERYPDSGYVPMALYWQEPCCDYSSDLNFEVIKPDPSLFSGAGLPPAEIGQPGDFWFDTVKLCLYGPKADPTPPTRREPHTPDPPSPGFSSSSWFRASSSG